jgi:hypothetical protein
MIHSFFAINKESAMRLTTLLPLLGALWMGTSAAAQNLYKLDDGVPNSGLSYGIETDYCWFQWFTTVGSADAITKVQVMFAPAAIPVGTPITLCVWEDQNDDGDPSDAVLVGQIGSVVPDVTSLAFTDFILPSPATVHGRFFVGAYLTTDGTFGTIALLDYNTPLSGRAYFATDAPGYFDPMLLSTSFYNHIETLGAGIHGVFMLRAEGGGAPTTYCTAKVNSLGCTPQIGYFGTPSASAPSGFFVLASSVRNRKSGQLAYSLTGRASAPFLGGTLCIASPVHRTPASNSGGSLAGSDCTGAYSFDFCAWNSGGAAPRIPAGTTVNVQYISRDPGFPAPNNAGLTDGLELTLAP